MKIDSRGNRKNGRFLGRENKSSARSPRLILDRIPRQKSTRKLYISERYRQRHDTRIIANEAKTAKLLRGSMCVCCTHCVAVCVCMCVYVYASEWMGG